MATQRQPGGVAGRESPPRQATFAEIQTLMGKPRGVLQRAISLPEARLMLPVDGRGVRVLVGVNQAERQKVPPEVTVAVRGQRLVISLEVDEKYVPGTIFSV